MYILPSPTARPYGSLLWAFWFRESSARKLGQSLVEYALILVLVAVVTIGAVSLVGNQTSEVFEEINCRLSGGTMHQDNGNGNSNKCVGGSQGNGNGNGNGNNGNNGNGH